MYRDPVANIVRERAKIKLETVAGADERNQALEQVLGRVSSNNSIAVLLGFEKGGRSFADIDLRMGTRALSEQVQVVGSTFKEVSAHTAGVIVGRRYSVAKPSDIGPMSARSTTRGLVLGGVGFSAQPVTLWVERTLGLLPGLKKRHELNKGDKNFTDANLERSLEVTKLFISDWKLFEGDTDS